jgi:acyl carrier protein
MEKNMREKIIEIISSLRPEIEFQSNQDVTLFGVLDSLDIILLVEDIESKLDVIIDPDQITPENFNSLDTLHSFIKSINK